MTVIRPARLADFDAIRGIERRAGLAFATVGLAFVADDEPPTHGALQAHLDTATVWVAVDADDQPLGYACASEVDREAHLDQVSVDPQHQRQGIGAALIEHVCAWARGGGHAAITLTTYRDVPWNAPAYLRLGFVPLADDELGPELAALRRDERARGLDARPRLAMRRPLA